MARRTLKLRITKGKNFKPTHELQTEAIKKAKLHEPTELQKYFTEVSIRAGVVNALKKWTSAQGDIIQVVYYDSVREPEV